MFEKKIHFEKNKINKPQYLFLKLLYKREAPHEETSVSEESQTLLVLKPILHMSSRPEHSNTQRCATL